MSPLRLVELSAPGTGGVACLLLEGEGALERVRTLAGGRPLPIGRAVLARLADGADPLDEALILARGPTAVELDVHASRPLVARLAQAFDTRLERSAAGAPGAETAREEAEPEARLARAAWRRVPDAPCEAAARALLDQAEGALAGAVRALPEDPAERRAAWEGLAEVGRASRWLFEPARVLLAGPTNAGKSTLFNALVGSRRVVTSPDPGTTRDVVEELVRIGEYRIRLVDAAGEPDGTSRQDAAGEDLERRGVALARRERERADLVLWLVPAGAAGPPPPPGACLVRTRADECPRAQAKGAICALRDPLGAARRVSAVIARRLELAPEPWQPARAVPFTAAQVAYLEATPPPRTAEDALAALAGAAER